jgi:hypothetical protein
MADITSPRNLNPARRHRSYPRVVRRARHNSYRVKRSGDTGTRYHGPPTIRLVNLPAGFSGKFRPRIRTGSGPT